MVVRGVRRLPKDSPSYSQDRQTDKQINRARGIQTYRQTDRPKEIQKYRQNHRRTDYRQTAICICEKSLNFIRLSKTSCVKEACLEINIGI